MIAAPLSFWNLLLWRLTWGLATALLFSETANLASAQAAKPAPAPRPALPRDHDCERTLIAYMGTAYLSRGAARNVLIDLMENDDTPRRTGGHDANQLPADTRSRKVAIANPI